MKRIFYILDDDHNPVETDSTEWSKWLNEGDRRRVELDIFENKCNVSTVFLGINHAFDDGPPILFETMIFGGRFDEYQERYFTWDEAIAGHEKALRMIMNRAYETEDYELVKLINERLKEQTTK